MNRVRVLLSIAVDETRMTDRYGPRPMTLDQDVRDLVARELQQSVLAADRVITDVRLEPLMVGRERIA